jgi:hypothetical protein
LSKFYGCIFSVKNTLFVISEIFSSSIICLHLTVQITVNLLLLLLQRSSHLRVSPQSLQDVSIPIRYFRVSRSFHLAQVTYYLVLIYLHLLLQRSIVNKVQVITHNCPHSNCPSSTVYKEQIHTTTNSGKDSIQNSMLRIDILNCLEASNNNPTSC